MKISINHKTIIQATLALSAGLVITIAVLAVGIGVNLLFPEQLVDQAANPQLQTVTQAIELIITQTTVQ